MKQWWPNSLTLVRMISCSSNSAVSSTWRWEGLRSKRVRLACNIGWIAVSWISDVKPIPYIKRKDIETWYPKTYFHHVTYKPNVQFQPSQGQGELTYQNKVQAWQCLRTDVCTLPNVLSPGAKRSIKMGQGEVKIGAKYSRPAKGYPKTLVLVSLCETCR